MTRWTLEQLCRWSLARLQSELDSLRADIRRWEYQPEMLNALHQAYDEEALLGKALDIVSAKSEDERTIETKDKESESKVAIQSVQEKFIESQEMALLAEERFRMDDLSGAVQLVNKSIQLEPSFAPFYR